jgi:hypothetical protein
MFKVSGIQIAAALAIFISMSLPTFAMAKGCGDKVGVCDRGDSTNASKPDFRASFDSNEESEGEPENPEPPEPEVGRTR